MERELKLTHAMNIADAARATRKYFVERAIGWFWVIDEQENVHRQMADRERAQAACDLLNAEAFLLAIREPSEETMYAGAKTGAEFYSTRTIWRAMVDALIAEVRG